MNEPAWLDPDDIVDIHARQLRIFGGAPGLRDRGLLESALGRALNHWHDKRADLPEQAAAYAYGLAKNHPFIDGNKRVAFLAIATFLRLNDVNFAPDPDEATAAIVALAAGDLDEGALVRWIRDNIRQA